MSPRSSRWMALPLLALCIVLASEHGRNGPSDAGAAEVGSYRVSLPAVLGGSGEPPRTADDLILQAVERGEISEETGFVYRVFAAFGDSRLPAEYRGGRAAASSTLLMAQVAEQWDTFSPQTQATLEPFQLPPYVAGSWWARSQSSAPTTGTVRASAGPPDGDPSVSWGYVDSMNGKARVWWQKRYVADGDDAKAKQIADAIEQQIWPRLFGTLGMREPLSDASRSDNGGDGRLDIALVDLGGDYGLTMRYRPGCEYKPVFIQLERALDMRHLEAAATHEIFHASQWAYDVSAFCLSDYGWLMEATATWAIDYVYPDNDVEHEFLNDFLDAPGRSLDTVSPRRHPYGAYLFPFYLARAYAPAWNRQIWEATETTSDSLEAIDAVIGGGFEDRWPEFARYNWNRPGADQYEQWDGITAGAAVAAEIPVLVGASGDQEISLPVDLPRLTARYYHLRFVSDDVRSIAFYNGLSYELRKEDPTGTGIGDTLVALELTPEQRKGAHVQALVKIAGKNWALQDWTNEPITTFCRDIAAERVEEIVVIFSNSDFEAEDRILEPQGLQPALWASNLGCWSWTGTTTSTVHWDQAPLGVATDVDETGNAMVTWTAEPRQVESDLSGRHYLPAISFKPTGTVEWSFSGTMLSCQASSGGSQPIADEDGYLQVYAFVVSGPAHRAYGGSGSTTAPRSTTWTCTDGTTFGPEDHTVTWFSPGDSAPWDVVKADGATIEGSYSATHTGGPVTGIGSEQGTWKLAAQREP